MISNWLQSIAISGIASHGQLTVKTNLWRRKVIPLVHAIVSIYRLNEAFGRSLETGSENERKQLRRSQFEWTALKWLGYLTIEKWNQWIKGTTCNSVREHVFKAQSERFALTWTWTIIFKKWTWNSITIMLQKTQWLWWKFFFKEQLWGEPLGNHPRCGAATEHTMWGVGAARRAVCGDSWRLGRPKCASVSTPVPASWPRRRPGPCTATKTSFSDHFQLMIELGLN